MKPFHYSAERVLDAPAELIYHCLSDYREHHRASTSGGFLPPAFTDLQVLRGGVGAGTTIRFTAVLGGRASTRTQDISEPEPGRVLVEWGDGEGSTFTVEPRGERTLLRIETVLNARGLEGVALHLFGARLLKPLYEDELSSLERYAQEHARAPHQVSARSA